MCILLTVVTSLMPLLLSSVASKLVVSFAAVFRDVTQRSARCVTFQKTAAKETAKLLYVHQVAS